MLKLPNKDEIVTKTCKQQRNIFEYLILKKEKKMF